MANILSWITRIDNIQLQKDSKKTSSIVGRMAKKVGGFLTGPAGMAIAAAAVGTAFKKIVEVNIEFKKSLSTLQSILGATNEEMTFFKNESIRLGSTTTQTASQVADAFKLIGSQKPELLASQEALLSVTEQAIILSEAAGIDVPTAAKALTGSLNQMSASAGSASEFVNILAAGSKVGAADIPYLNAAIEKSGAVARDANLSMEQLVAGIETIAPSISEPSTAGLQFKNVLLELQKAGYGFESGAFNLTDALNEVNTELADIEDPAKRVAAEMDIFGKISLVAGKALLNQTDAYTDYTKAVTGTNTALEQQAINTNNLQGSIDKFKSALEGAMLGLNDENGLNSALQKLVDIGTEVISNFDIVAEIFDYVLGPIGELFKNLFELGKTLGIVSDKGNAITTIMKILGTTTKISLLPLRALFEIVNLLIKGITWVSKEIKLFIKRNETAGEIVEWVQGVIANLTEKFNLLIEPIKKGIDAYNKFMGRVDDTETQPTTINNITDAANNATLALSGAERQASRLFSFISKQQSIAGGIMSDFNDQMDEITSTTPIPQFETESATGDVGAVITTEEIERLKIEAMADGIEKRLMLVDLETEARIQKYKDAGIYTTEIATQIEEDKNDEIQSIRDKFIQDEAQRILEIENLKIELMTEGINKRLAEINVEYTERLNELEQFNLTEQELIDAQNAIIAEKQLAVDEANQEHQQQILNEEKENILQEVALRESQVNLIELSEKRKREIEIENQILRLQAQRDFNLELTEMQKSTIDNQIIEQQRLLSETRNSNQQLEESYQTLANSLETFGKKFIDISKDEAKTQEEKTAAIKKALFEEVKAVTIAAITKYVASTLGTLGFPLGIIAAPVAGLAAAAIFAGLERFEDGGFVGGNKKTGDNVLVRTNSGEMIANQTQKDNLLWHLANNRTSYNNSNELRETNKLLREQTKVLMNQKNSLIYNNQLLEIKNGQLTGGKTFL